MNIARVELNTVMMRNTFMIVGKKGRGSVFGTCFIIGRPNPNQPRKAYFVLVTAAHALQQMEGEEATINLRRKDRDKNSFIKIPHRIKIRQEGKKLWTENELGLDIAAMYVALPNGIDLELASTRLFADDKKLTEFEIHPGDELYCLGFPLGIDANDAGFPILRSGKIASFPLIPTQGYRTFLLDFEIFPGNSGGPVYFAHSGRTYGGALHANTIQFIAGLVSRQVSGQVSGKNGPQSYPLHIAEIVHARYILETVNQLPELNIPIN